MDWRRVALWLCLAAVLVASIVLIARVSMRTFAGLPHAKAMLNSAVADACRSLPRRFHRDEISAPHHRP